MTETACVVTPVPQHYIPVVWPDLEKMLAPAVKRADGRVGIDDLYLGIADGTYAAWMVLRGDEPIAAYTTRIVEYPKQRTLVIDWVGGKAMSEWIDIVVRAIKGHARANGCGIVEGFGRAGWTRPLKKQGFQQRYVAYMMEIDDG